jgi:hypothetical protein
MKKKIVKKILPIITSILLTLAVYTGALFIYLYASGWRLDLGNKSIRRTGVLTVESTPTLATIYVDDKSIGRSSKSTSLDVGTYNIKVSKDGYYDWNKEVNILEEKSTPVFPWLIKTEFESKIGFNSQKSLEKYWIDETDNHLLLLLKDENGYEIVHYDINTEFWELNSNPTVILTLENTEEQIISDINIILSHSGEVAILEVFDNQSSSKYILPITKTSDYSILKTTPLSLDEFSEYILTWSYDDRYLILQSDEDVISYDLTKNTKHLLMKRVSDLDIWTTDTEGFFYIFKYIEQSEQEILKYSLIQYRLDGSSEREVIPAVYFRNNTEYIEGYRITGFDFSFFTNSPSCTQTIGEVTRFVVNQKAKGVYIQTDQSTYWYDMTTGKYITISPYPATLIGFSADNDNLLFKNSSKYEIFTFDKEDGDHTRVIGSKKIDNLLFDQIADINWISNSSYISFQEDNFVYIADIDGDNRTPILSSENLLYWNISASRDTLLTLSQDDTGINVILYTIQ